MNGPEAPKKYRVVQVAGRMRFAPTPNLTLGSAKDAKRTAKRAHPTKTFQIEVNIDGAWEAYE